MYLLKTSLLVLLLLCASLAHAESPKAQAEGVTRFELGQYVVYCLNEPGGPIAEEKIFLPADGAALKQIPDWNRGGMNFFVVDAGAEKYLIDAGNADGSTPALLSKAGIQPEAITTILLTHLHPDHIGGLLDAAGSKLFPKAQVYVAEEEAAYWQDTRHSGRNFELARKVLSAYADSLHLFAQNSTVAGAVSIPAFGHTPGHTTFRFESKGKSLLFWGDILHVPAQFVNPDLYLSYDVDPDKAKATRKQLMEQLAQSGEIVAGAHILAPGLGRLEKAEKGYRFTPGLD